MRDLCACHLQSGRIAWTLANASSSTGNPLVSLRAPTYRSSRSFLGSPSGWSKKAAGDDVRNDPFQSLVHLVAVDEEIPELAADRKRGVGVADQATVRAPGLRRLCEARS